MNLNKSIIGAEEEKLDLNNVGRKSYISENKGSNNNLVSS